MSHEFTERLLPRLNSLASEVPTPFIVMDEVGILETGERLNTAFGRLRGLNPYGFRNFFAVKADPHLATLGLMKRLGFGFDCSSIPELKMARIVGAKPEDIMFTSNNTSDEEFRVALADGGCIVNLDDKTLIERIPEPFPKLICFRYNPGSERTGNSIIGNPVEAKYGVTKRQIRDAYLLAQKRGAEQFGLHTMLCSNERNPDYMVETVKMLLKLGYDLWEELGSQLKFINMGGGLGIPYRPDDEPLPLERMAADILKLLADYPSTQSVDPHLWNIAQAVEVCRARPEFRPPALYMESGRYITGPSGVLVTTALNRMSKYKEFRGVDASMSALMRPGMYYPNGGYHHITVHNPDFTLKPDGPNESVNVVGSICENCDQFAHDRELPTINVGDHVLIHDVGAHGIAMAFQYNGRLRPAVLMLRSNGSVEMIRRAETVDDYLRTQKEVPDRLILTA